MRHPPVPVALQRDRSDCGPCCLAMALATHGEPLAHAMRHARRTASERGVSLLALAQSARQLGAATEAYRAPAEALDELPMPLIAHVDGNHYVVVESVSSRGIRFIDPAYGRDECSRSEFASRASGAYLHVAAPASTNERGPDAEGADRQGRIGDLIRLASVAFSRGAAVTLILLTGALQIVSLAAAQTMRPLLNADSPASVAIDALMLLLFLGVATLGLTRARATVWHSSSLAMDDLLTERALQHVLVQPLQVLASRTREDWAVRAHLPSRTREMLDLDAFDAGAALLSLPLVVSSLWALDRSLGFIGLISGVGLFALALRAAAVSHASHRRRFVLSMRATSSASESIGAVESLQLFDAIASRIEHWKRRRALQNRSETQSVGLAADSSVGEGLVALAGQVSCVAVAVSYYRGGSFGAGDVATATALTAMSLGRVGAVGRVAKVLASSFADWQRYSETFDAAPPHDNASALAPAPVSRFIVPTQSLSVRRLTVSLGGFGAHPVLTDVTFDLARGDRIALVGRNGSGKSTLLRCIAGLITDYEGDIAIDGVDARRLTRSRLAEIVTLAPQTPALFEGSVRENLLLANPSATEDQLRDCLVDALLCPAPSAAGHFLDTPVIPGASNFSAGERARLQFAQIFLRRPLLLLLDETTAALDPAAERQLLTRLFAVQSQATIVLCAHRLNALSSCDRILVMDDGRLAESGSHDALLHARGRYFEARTAFFGEASD